MGWLTVFVRAWLRQAEVDAGNGPTGALTTAEKEELSHLRREVKVLRMEHVEGGRRLRDRGDRARLRLLGGRRLAADPPCEAETIEENRLSYATPERDELAARVSAVLGVVYAMFNEGHTGTTGVLMRLDLQAEGLRLGRLLCDLVPRDPEVFGPFALMAFSAARAGTRVDTAVLPILLAAQDRAAWNKDLLRDGLMARAHARSIGGRGACALQAEIAAAHVTSPAWQHTDWGRIVTLYDAPGTVAPSPIAALNRAIAVSMRDGPSAGLAALTELERE